MTRAGYTVAKGFTLLYEVTAWPCHQRLHADTVQATLPLGCGHTSAGYGLCPARVLPIYDELFAARQRSVEDAAGSPSPQALRCFRTDEIDSYATICSINEHSVDYRIVWHFSPA